LAHQKYELAVFKPDMNGFYSVDFVHVLLIVLFCFSCMWNIYQLCDGECIMVGVDLFGAMPCYAINYGRIMKLIWFESFWRLEK